LLSFNKDNRATATTVLGHVTREERQLLRAHLPEVRSITFRGEPFPPFAHFATVRVLKIDFIQNNLVLHSLSARKAVVSTRNSLTEPSATHVKHSEGTLRDNREGTFTLTFVALIAALRRGRMLARRR
jgi:hypothetical protein